jgi:hypothetical protein
LGVSFSYTYYQPVPLNPIVSEAFIAGEIEVENLNAAMDVGYEYLAFQEETNATR